MIKKEALTNNIIDDLNSRNENWDKLESMSNQFQSIVEGEIQAVLDSEIVHTEIENKLLEKETEYAPRLTNVESQLAAKANQDDLEVERQRINQMQNIPEGGTTSDAALNDIKVDFNGKVYDSPGDAVRGQANLLNEDIVNGKLSIGLIESELHDYEDLKIYETIAGWKINPINGFSVLDDSYVVKKFKVTSGTIVRIKTNHCWQFQNTNVCPSNSTNRLNNKTYGKTDNEVIVPNGATYLIVSLLATDTAYAKTIIYTSRNTNNALNQIIENGYYEFTKLSNQTWQRNGSTVPTKVMMSSRMSFSDLIFVKKGTYVIIEGYDGQTFDREQWTEKDGIWTSLLYGNWETKSCEWKVDRDSYITVTYAFVDKTTAITKENCGIKTYIGTSVYELLKNNNGSILSLNKNRERHLFATCRYNLDYRRPVKDLCLTVFADIHASEKQCNNIIEYSNAYKNCIDGVICLGDIRLVGWQDPITFYINAISKSELPVYTVVGNHDKGDNTSPTNMGSYDELYEDFFAPTIPYMGGVDTNGKCYYYKDFTEQKIRMIVLNQYEQPNTKKADGNYLYSNNIYYSQEEIDWFVDLLKNTDRDYSVLLCYHNAVVYNYDNSDWTDFNHRGITGYEPTYVDRNIIPEIINAWKNSLNLEKNYPLSDTSGDLKALNVNADFTGYANGKFIAHLVGHTHCDGLGFLNNDQRFIAFNTSCDGRQTYCNQDTIRNQLEVDKDCFTVIGIDADKKVVRLCRIGATSTISMKERTTAIVTY